MGLRDRDYMQKKPSDDDWRRYNREMAAVEYGNVATKRYAKIRWLVIGFILLIVLIFIIALVVTGCSSSTDRYDPVIANIQHGVLVIPTNGVLQLPQRFEGITPRNEVYVEKKPDGRLLVLFPRSYGRGGDLDGFLFCSGSLSDSDFYTIDWGTGGKHQHLDVGDRNMLTVQYFKSHWYLVTRRLD